MSFKGDYTFGFAFHSHLHIASKKEKLQGSDKNRKKICQDELPSKEL